MRELSSCLSEYAVQVSDTSCSAHTNNSCIARSFTPSIQTSVTCFYRTTLSNQNQTTITVTWARATSSASQSLTVSVTSDEDPSAANFRINTHNSRYFRKSKGCKSLQLRSSKVELHWDLSTARYHPSGPEPLDGFYLVVAVDTEVALILGDKHREASVPAPPVKKKLRPTLVSRQEHFSGNAAVYSTKAQFCDSGSAHDIVIRCEEEGVKQPMLSVCVDKKTVIRVKRLQWNFRGNQTIFLDGLLVDLMWDVHDWFYNNPDSSSNYAVFMFKTRSGLDSRLWLEEKKLVQHDHHRRLAFSFIIFASKN